MQAPGYASPVGSHSTPQHGSPEPGLAAARGIGYPAATQTAMRQPIHQPSPLSRIQSTASLFSDPTAPTTTTMLSFLSPSQHQQFVQLFAANATEGFVPVSQMSELLRQSRVSNPDLAAIWNLASVCKMTGGFGYPEFALAMFLVQRRLSMPAEPLPTALPPNVQSEILHASRPQGVSLSLESLLQSAGMEAAAERPQSAAERFAKIPWAVSAEEKAQYDALFRQWDDGTGLIDGSRARQLFLQSGIPPSELWHIWNLADLHSIGKLNADEFAVAMHLIHQRLSGFPVPQQLPANLIPPSARQLSSTVEELKHQLARSSKRNSIATSVSSAPPSHRNSMVSSAMTRPPSTVVAASKLAPLEVQSAFDDLEKVYVSANRRASSNIVATQSPPITVNVPSVTLPPVNPPDTSALHREQVQKNVDILEKHRANLHQAIQTWKQTEKDKTRAVLSQECSKQIHIHDHLPETATLVSQKLEKFFGLWLDHVLDLSVPSPAPTLTAFAATPEGTRVLANFVSSSATTTPLMDKKAEVQAKAAKLLADRMAQLGIKAPLASPTTLTPAGQPSPVPDVEAKCKEILCAIPESLTTPLLESRNRIAKETGDLEKKISDERDRVQRALAVGDARIAQSLSDRVQKCLDFLLGRSISPTAASSVHSEAILKPLGVPPAATAVAIPEKPKPVSTPSAHLKSPIASTGPQIVQLPPAPINPIPQAPTNPVTSPSVPVSLMAPPLPPQEVVQAFLEVKLETAVLVKPSLPPPISAVISDPRVPFKASEILAVSAEEPPASIAKPPLVHSTSDDWLMEPAITHVSAKKVEPSPDTEGSYNPFLPKMDQMSKTSPPIETSAAASVKHLAHAFSVAASSPSPQSATMTSTKTSPKNSKEPQKVSPISETPKSPVKWPPVQVFQEETPAEDVFSDAFGVEEHVPEVPVMEPLVQHTKSSPRPFVLARALYDYHPQQDDELLLVKSAWITIPDMQDTNVTALSFPTQPFILDSDDWYFGRQENGVCGWFPASYVERVYDLRDDVCLIDTMTAVTEYHSKDADELGLMQGESVGVLDKSNKQWWRCVGLSAGKYFGCVGLCPAACFESTSTAEEIQGGHVRSAPPEADPFLNPFDEGIQAPVISVTPAPNVIFPVSGERRPSDSLFQPSGTDGKLGRPRALTALSTASSTGDMHETWSSWVAPEALAQITEEERKRQEAIFELIRTEGNYIRDLQHVMEIFYAPLRKNKLLSRTDLAEIFSNLEDIMMNNTKIMSDLENLQRESQFYVERIGPIFLTHLSVVEQIRDHQSSLSGYEETILAYIRYCSNQLSASRLVQRKRCENPKFATFLKILDKLCQSDPRCRSLDLTSFLLEPMQRITRYPLLIKHILHYTPKEHPDHGDLMAALTLAEQLLTLVNAAAKDAETVLKMNEVASMVDTSRLQTGKLDLYSPTRYLGPRECLHEGLLFKAKSGRKLYVYLFNDLVLMCEQQRDGADTGKMLYSVYRKPLPLMETRVREIPPQESGSFGFMTNEELCFQIICQADVLTVRAPDKKSKKMWMQRMEDAMEVARAVESQQSKSRKPMNMRESIGTLRVSILDCQDMALDPTLSRADVFCMVQLDRQQQKTKTTTLQVRPREPHRVRWNQSMMFSLRSFDQQIFFTVYCYDKYSQDDLIGKASMAVDFLEYYNGRETERITLSLRNNAGKLHIQMQYRPL